MLPANKHKFLDDIKMKIISKKWCWPDAVTFFWKEKHLPMWHFIIDYVYGISFNILGPKVCWFIKLKLIFGLGTWCSIVH